MAQERTYFSGSMTRISREVFFEIDLVSLAMVVAAVVITRGCENDTSNHKPNSGSIYKRISAYYELLLAAKAPCDCFSTL